VLLDQAVPPESLLARQRSIAARAKDLSCEPGSLRCFELAAGGRLGVFRSARIVPDDVAIMMRQVDDFDDISGPSIGSVMSRVGWGTVSYPWVAKIFDEDGGVVAAGWATVIWWKQPRDGVHLGINASYAVASHVRGQGLAQQCAAAALLGLIDEVPDLRPFPVNLQLRDRNAASAGVALSLGARPNPSADFEVPSLGARYVAFSVPAQEMIPRLQEILLDAASQRECSMDRAR